MRSLQFIPALAALAAALAVGPAARADDEPPLFPQTPAAPAPTPTPAASPEPAATTSATPAPAAVPPKPAAPTSPLRPTLDFARWQEMSGRERQTFVEGAVQSLGAYTARMRKEIGSDGRMSPEALATVVRFLDTNYPKRPPAAYLKEMESIYLTDDGRKLSILDCFLQAFRRANGR